MSASLRRAGRIAATLAVAVLAACTNASTKPGPAASGSGAVGYVRMEELVQKHPLYDQLARYDRSIDAFNLTAIAPQVAKTDPHLAERERELQKELHDAADRTQKLLGEKQQQYQQQESAAIAAAMRGAGQSGPSAAQIAGSVNATAQQQQSGVATQARRDLDSYRKTLQKQDAAQIAAAQKALSRPRQPHLPREGRGAAVQGVGALAQARERRRRRSGSRCARS